MYMYPGIITVSAISSFLASICGVILSLPKLIITTYQTLNNKKNC
jgi:hypothetical protein